MFQSMIQTLVRWRQEDYEFETRLSYTARCCFSGFSETPITKHHRLLPRPLLTLQNLDDKALSLNTELLKSLNWRN